ncbi:MAG: hypothetical protein M1376_02230 [Planctomycetes bacterium]|nr:hypothetical protein [Planctomycetota bacterium]
MDRNRPGRLYEDYVYGFLTNVCNELLMILAKTNTPDDERRLILEKFLVMLRTDDPFRVMDEGRFLVLDIGGKHGVHIYDAQVERQLREMRSKKQSQTAAP